MAKYYGMVGYAITVETRPGVWEETITEHPYYGDVLRNVKRSESSENLNDNIDISNSISIIGDPFAYQNFHTIKYATFMGTKWKVSSVEVQYPRLVLSIGGEYIGSN